MQLSNGLNAATGNVPSDYYYINPFISGLVNEHTASLMPFGFNLNPPLFFDRLHLWAVYPLAVPFPIEPTRYIRNATFVHPYTDVQNDYRAGSPIYGHIFHDPGLT